MNLLLTTPALEYNNCRDCSCVSNIHNLEPWHLGGTRPSGILYICSVQFSRSGVSDSLRPHELQHARPPCPSPTPGVHPDSRPLSQWCHPAISSSVVPFSPAPNPSQHQSLFQWVNSLHEVAKVLEFQLQHLLVLLKPGFFKK